MSWSKRLKYLAEYSGFLLVIGFFRMIPEFALNRIANLLASLVFNVLKFRRETALDNVSVAFPELSVDEQKKIAYGSYHHFILMILEVVKSLGWRRDRIDTVVELTRPAWLKEIGAKGNGAVVMTGHFGNWELGTSRVTHQFWHEPYAIQQRQSNPFVDAAMVRFRERLGAGLIYSRGAMRQGLAELKRGHALALLCDQDGGKRGVFVPFFGKMASTPIGSALLHLRSNKPIYFYSCVRTGPMKYLMDMEEIVVETDGEVNQKNLTAVTAAAIASLERYVRKYPTQYLWMHKRWKTPYVPENQAD
ncbi:MAG: lysophospholipid acyltransferase family protein [Calditrichia bacterium]